MKYEQIILPHNRQPVGSGVREFLKKYSFSKPIILSTGKGPLYRELKPDHDINVIIKQEREWENFLKSLELKLWLITNDEFCFEQLLLLKTIFCPYQGNVLPTNIHNYRNKSQMKSALQGVSCAESYLNGDVTKDSARELRKILPENQELILKPINSSNLKGIKKIYTSEINKFIGKKDILIERFYEGNQYYVDCLVDDGKVKALLCGKYLTPLLDFSEKKSIRWYFSQLQYRY